MNDERWKNYQLKTLGKPVEFERQLWQTRVSPCGNWVLGAGYHAAVVRWQWKDQALEPRAPFTAHQGWVQCLGLAAETQLAFSADSWGKLAAWSYATDELAAAWSHEAAHDGWIRALAVSPDGRRLATAGNDRVVRIWASDTGNLVRELPHPHRILSLAFHPSGDTIVSGDLKAELREWSWATGELRRTLAVPVLYQFDKIQECGGIRLIAFNAAGSRLVCGGQKSPSGGFATGTPCVVVWDWEQGELLREMPMGGTEDGFAYDACFHPEGFVMATSGAFPGKGHVWFWHPDQAEPLFQSNKITNGRSIALHPDGQHWILMVSNSPNGNGRALKDGKYLGGSARLHLLEYPPAAMA